MNHTDSFRVAVLGLWILTVLIALVGWAAFQRDPAELSPVIGWVTGGVALLESAKAVKRHTFVKSNGGSE